IATGRALRRLRMVSMACSKSAPILSILLMKQIRGTSYLSAWRHTVSDCGSTPCTASNTAQAPSSTRNERSTSAVKSTWPGVSMILIRMSRQKHVVAAEVIVMPRSEEHTSELQSRPHLVCRLLLYKKKTHSITANYSESIL